MLKALLMTVIGLMLSTVGTDQTQGVPRFTLGLIDLTDGISFLLLVMATFALSEALIAILKPSSGRQARRRKARLGQSRLHGRVKGRGQGDGAGDQPLFGARLHHRGAARCRCDQRQLPRLRHRTAARRNRKGQAVRAWIGARAVGAGNRQQRRRHRPLRAAADARHSRFRHHGGYARCADRLRHPAGPAALYRPAGRVLVGDRVHVDRQHRPVDPQPAADPPISPRSWQSRRTSCCR